jgi:hypothetical protein
MSSIDRGKLFKINSISHAIVSSSSPSKCDIFCDYDAYNVKSLFAYPTTKSSRIPNIFRFTLKTNKASTCNGNDYTVVPKSGEDISEKVGDEKSILPNIIQNCQQSGTSCPSALNPPFTSTSVSCINCLNPNLLTQLKQKYQEKYGSNSTLKSIIRSFNPYGTSMCEYTIQKDLIITYPLTGTLTYPDITSYLRVYVDPSNILNSIIDIDDYSPKLPSTSAEVYSDNTLIGYYTDGTTDENGDLIRRPIPYIAGYDIENIDHTTNSLVNTTTICSFTGTSDPVCNPTGPDSLIC